MTGREWIHAFAETLDVDPPDEATIEALLELAATAAHASERLAAPLACWLVGCAGVEPAAALADAQRVGRSV